MLAAVLALVDAVIRARQESARLFRVDREAEDAAFGPQTRPHLLPALAAVGADPGAGPDRPDTDREVIGHGCFLFAYFVSHPV